MKFAFAAGSVRRLDRTDASGHRMSNGRLRRAVDAARGVSVQRGRWSLEWSNGHGQRGGRVDGQPERMPFPGQNPIAAVRHDLLGSVFGVRGRQQSGHHTHGHRSVEGLAETIFHYTERQGK